jgi:hypothetical protein
VLRVVQQVLRESQVLKGYKDFKVLKEPRKVHKVLQVLLVLKEI